MHAQRESVRESMNNNNNNMIYHGKPGWAINRAGDSVNKNEEGRSNMKKRTCGVGKKGLLCFLAFSLICWEWIKLAEVIASAFAWGEEEEEEEDEIYPFSSCVWCLNVILFCCSLNSLCCVSRSDTNWPLAWRRASRPTHIHAKTMKTNAYTQRDRIYVHHIIILYLSFLSFFLLFFLFPSSPCIIIVIFLCYLTTK